MPDIGLRESFNHIWIWDTIANSHWELVSAKGCYPTKRMSHGADVLGCVLLVMGGLSTESRCVMDDFNLYDFYTETWLKVRMVTHKNRHNFVP